MRVIVTFSSVAASAHIDALASVSGNIVQAFSLAPIVVAEIEKDQLDKLRAHAAVRAVELDAPDAVKADVWHTEAIVIERSPSVLAAAPWGIARVHAPEVHALDVTGQSVRVAVIDTGIDYTHPDLASAYAGGFDFVNNDDDPLDDNSHGTHVAGTIAAALDTQGIYGVAPNVNLFALKALNASGVGAWSTIISAYEWCVQNNIHICNNSYSGQSGSIALETAFTALVQRGVIAVCSAGNSGIAGEVGYPAAYPGALAVGATDDHDTVASFSSRGAAVQVVAPGVGILSTILGGAYGIKSGTSMSSPHVVGIIALALSTGLSSAEVQARLTRNILDLGSPGKDVDYGYGLVDALACVTDVPPTPPTSPPGPSVPSLVHFDGTESSDPDGHIVEWNWDLGDGQHDTGAVVSHKYSLPGWYTVILAVKDDKGAIAQHTREVNIVPNQLPQLSMFMTYNPSSRIVPVDVVFDASRSSDSDGVIVSFYWEFGNGQTGTGPVVSNRYEIPGIYTVFVTLTDDQGGSVRAATSVIVTAPTTPIPPPTNQPPIASFTINGQ